MRLTREVRFFHGRDAPGSSPDRRGNRWAGTDRSDPVPPFWAIRATVEGAVDARTGYLCDIKQIDDVVRGQVREALFPQGLDQEDLRVLQLARRLATAHLAVAPKFLPPTRLSSLQLSISPFTHLTTHSGSAIFDQGESIMVRLTQSFEFSASHRLYCAELSDEENRRLFGKCSNPHGHGHNYLIEVTVGGLTEQGSGPVFDVCALDRIVGELVIEPLDHKNLNVECAEFATLNPTVENIARVIFQRLAGKLGDQRLLSVRVWETPKTRAEYSGEA